MCLIKALHRILVPTAFKWEPTLVKQSTCKLALTLRQEHPLLLPLLPYTTSAASEQTQVSTVTIAGTPAVGDTIAVTVGDKSYVHTVVAADIGDLMQTLRIKLQPLLTLPWARLPASNTTVSAADHYLHGCCR